MAKTTLATSSGLIGPAFIGITVKVTRLLHKDAQRGSRRASECFSLFISASSV